MSNWVKTKAVFRTKLYVTVLCLLCALICTVSSAAIAVSQIDTGETCALALNCSYAGNPLPGIVFRLYRVADVSPSASFTLSGDFRYYNVSLNNDSASEWDAAANTLATYIQPDGIQALRTGTTDNNGYINFGLLPTGLYLVVGERTVIGSTSYISAPFLVSLPNLRSNGTWAYAVDANPKISAEDTPTGGRINISVIKVWDDAGYTGSRPDSIAVTLYLNGSAYDTCLLTEANYWRHTWRDLSADVDWTVIEKAVPDGYTVKYSVGQAVLTITNTYDGEEEGEVAGDKDNGGGNLPQTGMLWWPVPFMASAGILLFSIGWWKRYSRNGKKDAK